jgi:AcrR family transcriptional regulator
MIFPKRPRNTRGAPSESRSQGEQTRHAILAGAMKIAAREGLAALTIGRLAKEHQMSKSGLFAHFHSKQALELATVEKAKIVFASSVLEPARIIDRGINRLWNLCDLWLSHIERRVFPGAYFFTGALFEYAGRPGPVAKAIKNSTQEWLGALRGAVEDAQGQKELRGGVRAEQIALELNGRLLGAYCAYLLEDAVSFREIRAMLLIRLRELATNAIPRSAFESLRAWKNYLEKQN